MGHGVVDVPTGWGLREELEGWGRVGEAFLSMMPHPLRGCVSVWPTALGGGAPVHRPCVVPRGIPGALLLHMSSPGNADFFFPSQEEEAVLQQFLARHILQDLCFPKCIRGAGVTPSSPAPPEGCRSSSLGYGPGCSPQTRSWLLPATRLEDLSTTVSKLLTIKAGLQAAGRWPPTRCKVRGFQKAPGTWGSSPRHVADSSFYFFPHRLLAVFACGFSAAAEWL